MKNVNYVVRGGIYFIDLFHEERYKNSEGVWTGTCLELKCRPYIVLTNDLINTVSPVVQVIPLTTVDKHIPSHIQFRFDGKDAFAMIEQLQAIDKGRISSKSFRGVVSPDVLDDIQEKLLQHLGFKPYPDNDSINKDEPKKILLETTKSNPYVDIVEPIDYVEDDNVEVEEPRHSKNTRWTDELKYEYLANYDKLVALKDSDTITKGRLNTLWKEFYAKYNILNRKQATTYMCEFKRNLNVVD